MKQFNFTLFVSGMLMLINMQAFGIGNSSRKTPAMGWASWNQFSININESIIEQTADAMVNSGLSKYGYTYINMDDGWFGGRDGNGNLKPNASKFPNGMKAVADYIHSKGLKAGIYSDAGNNTCGSVYNGDNNGIGVGFYGHEQQDANQYFINWGYDYIKVDWCGGKNQGLDNKVQYQNIANAILNTGKPVLFSICCWAYAGDWLTTTGDMWRTTGDINASWDSFTSIADQNNYTYNVAGTGHFNDPDMIEVGRGMSFEEDKSHFSLWCIMAAPLILGNDLRKMSTQTFQILTNNEVIAVDQDPACLQGYKIKNVNGLEVWMKPLGSAFSGQNAVMLFNRTGSASNITINMSDIGLSGNVEVRDLWQHSDKGIFNGSYTANVPSHGCVMLKISGNALNSTYYKFTNLNSGKIISVENSSTSSLAKIIQTTDNSDCINQWSLVDVGSGYKNIINRLSGKSIVVADASADDNAAIILWNYSSGSITNDEWQIIDIGGGYNKIINKLSGKALTVYYANIADGTKLVQYTYNGGDNQKFKLNAVPGSLFDTNSFYQIINQQSNKSIVTENATLTDAAKIIQWDYTADGITNDEWKFTDTGSGFYKIVNRNSGKLIDVSAGSFSDGAIAIQWFDNGMANQQWQLINNGSGIYTIKSKNSGKVLDVTGGAMTNGAQIIQWTDYANANQRWMIVPVSLTKAAKDVSDILVFGNPKVEIFPNPTKGVLNVNINGVTNGSLKIINLSGQLFYENENVSFPIFINLESKLLKGIYIIKIITLEGTFCRKFIIE